MCSLDQVSSNAAKSKKKAHASKSTGKKTTQFTGLNKKNNKYCVLRCSKTHFLFIYSI